MVFEGQSFHLGQAPAARLGRRNKDHMDMDRASTLEDDALRARDALRVAKRAHASGQHGAALNFARQSLKLFPTSEAQALLDRISKAAAQRAEASHSEEDDEDDEDEYRAPRRSRGTSKGSGYSRPADDDDVEAADESRSTGRRRRTTGEKVHPSPRPLSAPRTLTRLA